jgi:transcriptional regulator with XRE-family HTH domain
MDGCVDDDRMRQAMCAEVARLLRVERQRQGLSLGGLAEKAGLSRQMISYVEQGERNPTLDTLLRVAAALGIELDEVIRRARESVSLGT